MKESSKGVFVEFQQLPDAFGHLASLRSLTVSGLLEQRGRDPAPKPNAHSNFRITDPTLLAQIEEIHLQQFNITEALLADLAALPRLRLLNIWAKLPTGTPDRGLSQIANCSGLEELWLTDDTITDDELSHLATLRRLRVLQVLAPKLTDASLATLAQFKSLEDLSIPRSTNLSNGGIHNLKAAAVPIPVRPQLFRHEGMGLYNEVLLWIGEPAVNRARDHADATT